jgi:hypothetical protein
MTAGGACRRSFTPAVDIVELLARTGLGRRDVDELQDLGTAEG